VTQLHPEEPEEGQRRVHIVVRRAHPQEVVKLGFLDHRAGISLSRECLGMLVSRRLRVQARVVGRKMRLGCYRDESERQESLRS